MTKAASKHNDLNGNITFTILSKTGQLQLKIHVVTRALMTHRNSVQTESPNFTMQKSKF